MRILYVVQRYGEEIAGGAEQHTRAFAERMVGRGHRVEVLTTTAASYVDWAGAFPPGFSRCNEVGVRRVPVRQPRNGNLFGDFNARMVLSRYARPLTMQREWMRMEGPEAPELVRFLRRRARDYDVVVFITYLYWTAWAGLQACAGSVPTVLHPTAHDEPPLRLSIFDEVLRLPDALAFLTPEEEQIVQARFPGAPGGDVIGIGIDTDRPGQPDRFRARFGLGDAPYLLYVGRVDPAKGAAELLDFFDHYKQRNPGPLRLVLLGEQVVEFERRSDLVVTDFVDEATRDDALAGMLALVQPSYFESFSLVLNEAFAQGRPALVQGRCGARRARAPERCRDSLQRLCGVRSGSRPPPRAARTCRRDGRGGSSVRDPRVPMGARARSLRTVAGAGDESTVVEQSALRLRDPFATLPRDSVRL